MIDILIVEDDPDLLFLYNTALAQYGYHIFQARNGAEALEYLQLPDFKPSVIILDMMMPDAPGTRTIDYVRRDSRFDDTHIVVVSANDMYRERIEERNISRFLVKPITIGQLVKVISSLLS